MLLKKYNVLYVFSLKLLSAFQSRGAEFENWIAYLVVNRLLYSQPQMSS